MDDDLPRPRGDAASLLAKEGLDPYSQAELAERIAAHRDKVAAHRQAADAFFKPRSE